MAQATVCGEPAISLHSHHVSLVQWATRLLPVTRDPGSNPLGGTYVKPGFSCQCCLATVAKIQLAPALLLFKKYLIKKWLILSLVHPIGHSLLAGTEAGLYNKRNERNNM
jgi:hypothetical protein